MDNFVLPQLLWKLDREKKGLTKKQSFLDMGCGNGLLVHILAAEGVSVTYSSSSVQIINS